MLTRNRTVPGSPPWPHSEGLPDLPFAPPPVVSGRADPFPPRDFALAGRTAGGGGCLPCFLWDSPLFSVTPQSHLCRGLSGHPTQSPCSVSPTRLPVLLYPAKSGVVALEAEDSAPLPREHARQGLGTAVVVATGSAPDSECAEAEKLLNSSFGGEIEQDPQAHTVRRYRPVTPAPASDLPSPSAHACEWSNRLGPQGLK